MGLGLNHCSQIGQKVCKEPYQDWNPTVGTRIVMNFGNPHLGDP